MIESENECFVLVKWLDGAFDVVNSEDVLVAEDETLVFEDKEYLVNWQGKRYRGFVMSMG